MFKPIKQVMPTKRAIDNGWCAEYDFPGVVLEDKDWCISFLVFSRKIDGYRICNWNKHNLVVSDIKPKQMENK